MKSRIVPVSNVMRLTEAAEDLVHRGYGLPGLGLVTGETGYGKTTAVTWLINRYRGVYVRALATWGPSSMLSALCKELIIKPSMKCSDMMDDLIEKLAEDPRPIFIDEADYIVDSKKMTESARDLHDMTSVPVIMIGMGDFAQKIAHRKQFTGRILSNVVFEPLSAADARLLADQLCEVKVRDDLLDRIHRLCRGATRNTIVSLTRTEKLARVKGLMEIGAADMVGVKDDFFFTGQAPTAPKPSSSPSVAPLRTPR
jgi:hypothetical protein